MKTQQNRKSMPASCAACTVLCLAVFGLAIFGTAFIGCQMSGDISAKPHKPAEAVFGTISGKVAFTGSANLAGIPVTLEKTNGQLSLAVISAAQDLARGIVPSARSASTSMLKHY
ncbi:MAG: hypothetical protein FWH41_09725 [Treponema sp.]|nr:hypothetical protein [Treponema sp.]